MINKKLVGIAGAIIITTTLLAGCGSKISGSQKEANRKQKQILEESNRQIGMPNIKNFYEKKMAKDIWELRDNANLTTYAYTKNMNGKYVYLGRCMGFGLPYTTQYTNPEARDTTYSDASDVILPQADPNGLYSSASTSATWLMLVNEETNEQEVIYAEPEIVVTQSKLPKRLVEEWSLPANY